MFYSCLSFVHVSEPLNLFSWRLATSSVMDSTIKTRYVELYILADEALEASHGRDRQRVNQKIASIVAMMNSLYKPLNIEFLVQHIKVTDIFLFTCAKTAL